MRSAQVLSAVAAVAGLASAATTCTKAINITTTDYSFECDVVDATVTVDPSLTGTLTLEGASELKQGLTVNNASGLIGISSSSITTIGGTLLLSSLQTLASFDMQNLTSVNSLEFNHLQALSGLTLGTKGVTKASSIKISDTHISDLSNLNIASADTITIDNNLQLKTFNAKLQNITTLLSVTNNANSMQINMSMLESAGELDFRVIQSFDAPILSTVGRLSFQESPNLLSVSANNLTEVTDSLTLTQNNKLANISFKALEDIKGDMTIQNNTALQSIDTFPELQTVGGAILLTGTFNTVKLPKLATVNGTVTVTSSTDISSFCKYFDDLKSNKKIQGKETCTSNVKTQDQPGTKNGTSGSGNSDNGSAAVATGVNTILFGVVAAATLAHLL